MSSYPRFVTAGKNIFRALCLMLFLFAAKSASSQISSTGRTFYMSFMEMEARTGGFPDSLLLFITAEKNTTAVIDNPRLTGTSVTINITAGRVNRYAVDPGFYYPTGSEFSSTDLNSRRGLRLVAKDPVNVYCMNLEQNRSDGTFVLPYESIPKAPEYFVTAYTPNVNRGGFGTPRYMCSQFVVVGMDNNTQVEITPRVRTKGGKPAGTPFTVTLSRGQVYQVQSTDTGGTTAGNISGAQAINGDLTGTRIRVINGCGKINVFAGNRSVFIPWSNACSSPGVDHLYTQVFPTSILGKDYIFTPFRGQTGGYVYRILCTQNSTEIYVNGTLVATRNAGQYYLENVTTGVARCIRATKPVYAIQYMKNGGCSGLGGNQGDAAILLMPDINQRLLKTVLGTATTNNMNTHAVNVLIPKGAKNAVKFNGSFLSPGSFTDVPCGNYAYAQVSVANPSTNTIECDSGFIGVAYGVGQFESYSYCSGALFENLEYDFTITRSNKCPNSPVQLQARIPTGVNPSAVIWDFGDNTPRDTGRKVTHAFLRTGSFFVTMRAVVAVGCGANDTFTRSKIIDIVPGPTVNFPDTITKCGNARINEVFDGGNSVKFIYKWQDSSTARFFTARDVGKVWLRVTDTSTRCSARDSVVIRRAAAIDANVKWDTAWNCFNRNFYALSDSTNYNGDSKKSVAWRLANPYKPGDTVKTFTNRFRRAFDTIGNYYLEYIVFSKKGCGDTFRTFLKVNGMPTARIWSAKPEYCQQEQTDLLDSSSGDGGIGKTFWTWGDGNRDTVTNRLGRHRYANFDTFAVNMITETVHGCRDTADSSFVVHPLPIPKMSSKTNNQCFKQNSFDFDDISNGMPYGTYNRYWRYNGTTAIGVSSLSSVKFKDTGWFTVTRIDTSNYGCMDSVKQKVYVAPEPRARIFVVDSVLCFKNHYYHLDDRSVIGSGTIASRLWTFSDGSSSTIKTLTKKTFSADGTYTVKLVETSDKGCKDSVSRNLVVYLSPRAQYSVNDSVQCLAGNSFAFSPIYRISVPGLTVNHNWDFGDNSSSATEQPVISYSDTGTFRVRYVVSTGQGCADTAFRRIRVDAVPRASFTSGPDSTCLGKNKFDFRNTTSFGGTYNSNWRLGDGNTASTRDVLQKDYTAAGNYSVKLVVTSPTGCRDSVTRTVKVFPIPQAAFNINDDVQCLTGNSFVFTDASNTNAASGVTYTWTLTPGSAVTGRVLSAQTFADTGTYTMRLDVMSDRGCSTSLTKSIYVAESPDVTITADPDACQGEIVDFTSTVALNRGTITNYNWSFGDGGTSAQPNPSRAYNAAGSFNVTLTVTSSNGCTGTSAVSPVTIYAKPKADFISEYLLSRGMETDWKFTFTGANASAWDWQFEDGQSSSSPGPVLMTFNDTGNFRVTLRVISPDFCVDSISKFIFLKPELLFWLPTSFSPNNDGLNETFGPNTTFGLSKYRMQVFDRWGGMLFESNDPAKGWNGRDPKGEEVPEGVYAYSINFRYIDGKIFVYNGSITLIR